MASINSKGLFNKELIVFLHSFFGAIKRKKGKKDVNPSAPAPNSCKGVEYKFKSANG